MSAKLSSKNFYGGNLMVKCFVALVIFFCSVGNLFAQTETKVTINVDKVVDQNSVGTVTKRNKGPFRL
mgnify:CR=1 FL=1